MGKDKKKSFKEGGKGSGIGNFLRSIDKDSILGVAGIATSLLSGNIMGALGNIKNLIDNDPDMTAEQKAEGNRLIELEYADLANARQMQIEVSKSEHTSAYAKNFVYYFATGVILFSFTVVILLFFVEIPEGNKDVVNFILGIIIGTGLVGIFQYFFGSSQGSKDAGEKLRTLLGKKSK